MIDPDLAIFVEVAKSGSLAGAARKLGISPPMVSRRLARLEARLGVTLARRSTRQLSLTAQGKSFYQEMSVLLDQVRQAEERVLNAAHVVTGPLHITAPTSFGRIYLAKMIKPFLDRYPDVQVSLDLSDKFVNFTESPFDLAVRITGEIAAEGRTERIASSRRLLCASSEYLRQHGAPKNISELHNHKVLAADGQLPWKLVQDGEPITVSMTSHVATNSSEVVRELTLAGGGIALRSMWDVYAELRSGRLHRILPNVEGPLNVNIYAIRPDHRTAPAAAEAFVAMMRKALQPVAPWEVHMPSPPFPAT